MTNLELVQHDPSPCGNGLPINRTVVAMSTSYSALENHCSEKYSKPIGKPSDDMWAIYYTIQESNVIIVPSKF